MFLSNLHLLFEQRNKFPCKTRVFLHLGHILVSIAFEIIDWFSLRFSFNFASIFYLIFHLDCPGEAACVSGNNHFFADNRVFFVYIIKFGNANLKIVCSTNAN